MLTTIHIMSFVGFLCVLTFSYVVTLDFPKKLDTLVARNNEMNYTLYYLLALCSPTGIRLLVSTFFIHGRTIQHTLFILIILYSFIVLP